MENKIQELTDKIYREGVEKGNEEAQRLVSEAQAQAEKLIEDAKKQAESILAEAKKSADELNENTKSELKLFAGQAVNALKTEVANLLTNQTVEETVKGFTADKEFLYKFILALAEKWSANEPIEISVKDADRIAVMDDGEIVGIGTHKELVDTCDIYREICYSQEQLD